MNEEDFLKNFLQLFDKVIDFKNYSPELEDTMKIEKNIFQ